MTWSSKAKRQHWQGLLVSLLLAVTCCPRPGCPTAESDAHELLRLRQGLHNNSFVSTTLVHGWRLDVPLCTWSGVQCENATNQVIELNLQDAKLEGTLPAAWGANGSFQQLLQLQLSGNALQGQIGSIWSVPGSFPMLVKLDMGNNSLSGTLPASWGLPEGPFPALQDLQLGWNRINGLLPEVWAEEGRWPQLYAIILFNNMLRGSLPEGWAVATAFRNLRHIIVEGNCLTGTLPASYGHPDAFPLQYLVLAGNQFQGTIPEQWGADGAFPELIFMKLSNNRLTGRMPSGWGLNNHTTVKLFILHLDKNRLTGSLPSGLLDGSWAPEVFEVALNDNLLTGTLPPVLRSPSYLIDVSSNLLHGTLPQRLPLPFLNLPGKLLLSNNSFTGTLPKTWTSLGLMILSISAKNLGPIPLSWYDGSAFPELRYLDTGNELQQQSQGLNWRKAVCLNSSLYDRDNLQNMDQQFTRYQAELDENTKRWSTIILNFSAVYARFPRESAYQTRETSEDWAARLGPQTSLRQMCQNSRVGTYLGALWCSFAAVFVLMYLVYRVMTPGLATNGDLDVANRAQNKLLASLGSLIFYWYAVLTDLLVVVSVWPDWPAYPLLMLLLLQFFTSGCLLCQSWGWGFRRVLAHALSLSVLLLTPVVDTLVTLREMGLPAWPPIIATIDPQVYHQSRDVVKAVLSSLPSAIITSVVFYLGNRPDVGLVLTNVTFVLSVAGNAGQIMKTWAQLLIVCALSGTSPAKHVLALFHGKGLHNSEYVDASKKISSPSNRVPADAPDTSYASDASI